MAEAPPYEQALGAAAGLLDALAVPAMFIGGLAVIAHGHVRTTDDIDATVSGERVTPDRIVQIAATFNIRPRIDDALTFARRTHVLLLAHGPTGIALDLSLVASIRRGGAGSGDGCALP